MREVKTEWNAVLICEIVFGIIGTIFTVLGAVFGFFIEKIAASPNSHGNVYVLPWIFCTLGIVFLLVFAVLFSVSRKRKNRRKLLIESGSCINARVVEVKQDLFVKINRRHPYYVICEGTNPYTGERLTFRSADITENLSCLSGQYLRVYVDYNDPENYYVELQRDYGN